MNFDTVDLLCACSDEIISMAFRDPSLRNSYTVKDILGLDVEELVTNYIGKGAGTDSLYNMNVGKREVVLKFGITPRFAVGETVGSLRDNIYRAVSANRTGAMTLRFKANDQIVASIKGFTTKIEAKQFSDTPEIQLTLDCSRDPLLRSEDAVIADTEAFENNLAIVEDNISTAPHGMGMSFRCDTATTSFTISDESPQPWSFVVTPGVISGATGFRVGDSLHISSEDHNHQLYIVRGSETFAVAQGLALNSIWPYMYPGRTTFRYSDQFTCTGFLYRHAFWGI